VKGKYLKMNFTDSEYVFEDDSIGKLILKAIRYNCELLFPKPNELFIDHDDSIPSYQNNVFSRFMAHLECRYLVLNTKHWKSKSGNNHRVIVLADNLDIVERIALQVMAGSDPIREMYSLWSHKDGFDHPICLFKPLPKLLTAGE
jgi:hypothetical protein